VRPTQALDMFGNVSTPFRIFAIGDLSIKILRRSSQGNPSVGGVKAKQSKAKEERRAQALQSLYAFYLNRRGVAV